MMNIEGKSFEKPERFHLKPADRWILHKLNVLIREVTDNMERYELGIAVQNVYDFIWDEFCDWYLEMAKVRIWKAEYDQDSADYAMWTLRTVLTQALKLLHPFMPFVTEEIYCTLLPEEESIMISQWPTVQEEWDFPLYAPVVESVKEAVRGVRNIRAEMNVPHNKKTKVYIVGADDQACEMYELMKQSYQNFLSASKIRVQSSREGIPEDAVSVVVSNAVVYLPLDELVDLEKEKERLQKEEKRLTKEIARAEGMLNNPNFVNKAPEKKIQEEREKLQKYQDMMAKVRQQLEQMKRS